MNLDELEASISALSYAIWEREGRQEGRAEEYWERARRQIESDLMAAAIEGKTSKFVLPQLRISQRPVRRAGLNSKAA
jgi:hypothetical protein